MDIGTWLHTLLHGRLVGKDAAGNRYYQEKRPPKGARARRWVLFKGVKEASAVEPGWHGWLHHTVDAPLPEPRKYPWQKAHLPNLTGTPASYRPPGHEYQGGLRAVASGDYEAWTPEQP
jgi:NADH:ubiquinone oxidoreductase subunit